MFEIGRSLREKRLSRGLELTQVGADTCIRVRYLRALEEERFDRLPGTAYVRGFLRTYASYLGFEEQHFIDEYNARFAPVEDLPITPLRVVEPRSPRSLAVVGALFAVALIAVIAWSLDGTGSERSDVTVAPLPARKAKSAAKPPALHSSVTRRTERASLALTAAHGPCWLLAYLGAEGGKRIYMGTLEQGRSLHLVGKRLWIRLGAPRNLDASVNAKRVDLPDDTANVAVTARGVETLASE